MDYWSGYILFGTLFLVGTIGYWVVTRLFLDDRKTYARVPIAKGTGGK